MPKHDFSTDPVTRAAREVWKEELEHTEDISNRVLDQCLEETSRDGAPSLLRSCIDRRVVNQVYLEKAKIMEEMRAAVKIEVKDQIGLAIEIGRSFASSHDRIPRGYEYAMPEDTSNHERSPRKNNRD